MKELSLEDTCSYGENVEKGDRQLQDSAQTFSVREGGKTRWPVYSVHLAVQKALAVLEYS